MNVYDFDDTLFDHNSTSGFYFYELRRHPGLARFWPRQLWGFLLYGLRLIDVTAMKSHLYCFLKGVSAAADDAESFWDANISHIHSWYAQRRRDDDLVISGSPYFIVAPACRRLGIKRVLASDVDPATGLVKGPNCSGNEKTARFKASPYFGPVEEFYSDSRHDQPMADMARRAWLVRGERLVAWPWGKGSPR